MPTDPNDPHDTEDLAGEATNVSAPTGMDADFNTVPEALVGPKTAPNAVPPRRAPVAHAPVRPAPKQQPAPSHEPRPADAPLSAHKLVPPSPKPAGSPRVSPPLNPAPIEERTSAVPEGLVAKAPSTAFKKRGFTGTIMGTMVFLAQSKKIPLGVKIGAPLLIIAGMVTASLVFVNVRAREAATATLNAALALPPHEAVPRVRELDLSELEPDARARAIRFLGQQRDAASVNRFIEALGDTPEVQRAAVGALAAVGAPGATPAADALGGLLDAENAELARDAAWALVRIEDGRGIPTTLENIAAGSAPDLPSYDPRTLAETMGRDGLLQALGHASPTIRQLAAYHLGDYCQTQDTLAISAIARDDDAATADTAIVTLARCDPTAAASFVSGALESGIERWNGLYTRMRQDAGAAGLGLLLPFAPDAAAHRWIVREMAASGDARAADALLAELERVEAPSVQDRLDTALALSTGADGRLLDVLGPLLQSADDDHAMAAIAMLGHASNADAVAATLVDLVRGDSPARRNAAIDAMASAGVCSDDAQRQLARLWTQRPHRAHALRALGGCRAERAVAAAALEVSAPLATPVSAEAGAYRLAALYAVTAAEHADVAPALYDQLIDPGTDGRVRDALADALAELAPDGLRDRALDQMMDPEVARPIRLALRRMLAGGVSTSSVPRLLGFVRGGADDDRTRDAAIVLGLAHHAGSREELVGLLSDDRARRHAALALLLGGDAETAGPLAAAIAAHDDVSSALASDLQHPPWTFIRGRSVLPDLASAVPLRDARYVAPLSKLCEVLSAPPEGLRAPTPIALRRELLHSLVAGDTDDARALAAEGLACSGARSAVLNVRDGRATGAAAARRALSQVGARDE